MPTEVETPISSDASCEAASYPSVPDLPTIPTGPFLYICGGIIPRKLFPGEIVPAQFGPVKTILFS